MQCAGVMQRITIQKNDVAVCCSVLQRVAVYCCVLFFVAEMHKASIKGNDVAACCSALQRVAVC